MIYKYNVKYNEKEIDTDKCFCDADDDNDDMKATWHILQNPKNKGFKIEGGHTQCILMVVVMIVKMTDAVISSIFAYFLFERLISMGRKNYLESGFENC